MSLECMLVPCEQPGTSLSSNSNLSECEFPGTLQISAFSTKICEIAFINHVRSYATTASNTPARYVNVPARQMLVNNINIVF